MVHPPRLSDEHPARRLEALDGLRGLAAVAIVVLHVWMFDHGDAGRPEKTILDRAIGEMRLGVTLFFVLSGFLLFRPFLTAALRGADAPALGTYALRRAARIVPGYVLAVLVSFALLRWLDHARAIEWSELPVFLLFLQNFDPSTLKQLDPPMWSLTVEVTFYVALPLAGIAALRAGPSRAGIAGLCGALVAGGIALSVLGHLDRWPPTTTDTLLGYVPEFAAGMLAATLVHGRTLRVRTGWALVAGGAALVLANAWWHGYGIGSQTSRELGADLPAVAGFALVVAGLAAAPLRARVLTSRPVQLAGTLSYGIYLLHFPAIDLLRGIDRFPDGLAAALVATLALCTAGAAISWYAVERPVLRAVRRRTRPAPARAPQRARPRPRPQTEPARS
jgi:peptidoglycan/LPS O-acetylase OafA/YrhL